MRVKHFLSTLMFSLLSVNAMAAAVDRDNDGLIEINNLDDLNEMRNDVYGTSLRGSSTGCPTDTSCFGYELTRDLDFDSNGDGILDALDWNNGDSWVPVGSGSPDTYSAVFNGNGHTISNLKIEGALGFSGFFGYANDAEIKNLGLVNANVRTESEVTYSAALIGYASSSTISNCYVKNASVKNLGSYTGGVIGGTDQSSIKNTYFIGDIESKIYAGGLIGTIVDSLVTSSYAKGSIKSLYAGGLIYISMNSGISSTYTNVEIHADEHAGGLIGAWNFDTNSSSDPSYLTISNSYSLGEINSTSKAGGLVYSAFSSSNPAAIKNSYAKNVGNLIYVIGIGNGSISFNKSYWIQDPESAESGNSAIGTGQPLADMQCASNPVNTNCAQPNLFKNWDKDVWDFGTDSQLPALKLKSNYPWFSTDKTNGEGDFESIARMKEYKPEYACDTPSVFAAKEIKSGYVFSTKTPDQLKNFSVNKGLTCLNADQADGSCNNYETSIVCSTQFHAGFWTSWVSNDKPNDGSTGDHETQFPSHCTAIKGIRARVIDEPTVYYGAPQKLSTFSLQKGLTCKNDDNADGCKNYEVRMTCEVLGDRE